MAPDMTTRARYPEHAFDLLLGSLIAADASPVMKAADADRQFAARPPTLSWTNALPLNPFTCHAQNPARIFGRQL